MRVIAGRARSITLVTPPGSDTRPTTDRIKETLFNMINQELPDCRFLDLFAGSGAIGIEALSRGASEAVFVEREKAALGCISKNLQKTGMVGNGRVLAMDIQRALKQLEKEGRPFGIIFMDPPYQVGWEGKMLSWLKNSPICTRDTLIIMEAALETDFGLAASYGFHMVKEKKYKTNKHVFLRKEITAC